MLPGTCCPPPAGNKKPLALRGERSFAVPPCDAGTSRCLPWPLLARGARCHARESRETRNGAHPARPTRSGPNLPVRCAAQRCIDSGGAAPGSQRPRLSVVAPIRILSSFPPLRDYILLVPRVYMLIIRRYRTAPSGKQERAEGCGDKRTALPSPSSRGTSRRSLHPARRIAGGLPGVIGPYSLSHS